MANQKPVDEIRIGRVKATIWRNGTDEQPRHNVTFSRLYKDGDQWKSTHSFGRNDLLVLAKVADFAHTRIFQLPAEAELPEVQVDESWRATAPGRGGADRFAALVLFLSRSWTNPAAGLGRRNDGDEPEARRETQPLTAKRIGGQ